MTFPYKKVLVIGATSGIGLALAQKLIENGSHVIAVGRRQDKLKYFLKEHGPKNASVVQFDITNLDMIQSFVNT